MLPPAVLQQARDQLEHRGLAHAVGPDQGDHFLGLDAERQAIQQQARTARKRDVPEFKNGGAH
jgi:hypothetical protein